jgi:hypothetical protein
MCGSSMVRTKVFLMSKWNSGKRTCDQCFPHTSENIWRISATASRDELKAVVSERKALNETLRQAIVLTPQNTPQNILSLQIVPNSQNISPPPEQSSPQNNSAPPPLEQSPSRNIPPPSGLMTDPARAERAASPVVLDANNLTMQQALDLFELLQARKSKEAEKAVTVEAEPVSRAPVRAEPLSYLTLGTVEGIVESTSPDALQEQTSSWEGKVEKYMRLSYSYSSDNTISGEKCYMVDEALYKDILLAVAARKQNESTLSSASEKLEQHINQIEDGHSRVIQREKDVIDQFVAGITLSQAKIRMGQSARMKAVMADILALKDSITASSDRDQNSQEMQRLKFQVAQYEGILLVYQSRLKDTEELNKSWTMKGQSLPRTSNGSSRNWTVLSLSSSSWESLRPSGKEDQP